MRLGICEAELGHVGMANSTVKTGMQALTEPELASLLMNRIDCLAVAIEQHGAYNKGQSHISILTGL
ncbi:MAG: class II fructose-bisphosphate aldolase [[Clostridium] scindens]